MLIFLVIVTLQNEHFEHIDFFKLSFLILLFGKIITFWKFILFTIFFILLWILLMYIKKFKSIF